MKILQRINDVLSGAPEWVFLLLCPALLFALAVLFLFLRRKLFFFPLALSVGAAGFLVVQAKDYGLALTYLGCYLLLAGVCSLFLLPHGRRTGKRKTGEEKLYEKFREELSERPPEQKPSPPPKVCCFREESAEVTENEMRLSYAESLLKKLRTQKLNAGDRLETEELCRRLDGYRKSTLTEREKDALNDCLATVLKLTAKYKL